MDGHASSAVTADDRIGRDDGEALLRNADTYSQLLLARFAVFNLAAIAG